MASVWGITPRRSIEAECRRRGRAAVIAGCVDLLSGRSVDDDLMVALGGPHAEHVLAGYEGGKDGSWPRVWATRGLLHEWDDVATRAIITATGDDAWRVREMAAKVIAGHQVGDALGAVVQLRDDPVPRVASAARRAVEILTGALA
ncbi:MAG: hypothetical protein ACRD0B_04720 [Acidimicrobiales bacterium]